ncbi:hypothetical protein ABZU76_31115 [Amycolatopsis sp. NPDC005232]|uniref:hypothetical protein n=1 Tax=Amycolatopsis sp. NPDC005232 TaxID=3157027 RepID=UPI0033A20CF0
MAGRISIREVATYAPVPILPVPPPQPGPHAEPARSVHPAKYRIAPRKSVSGSSRFSGTAPTRRTKSSRIGFSRVRGPAKQPPKLAAVAPSPRSDQSSSGIRGCQSCHSANSVAAVSGGNCRSNDERSGASAVRKVNDVTMPKLPPPPPRNAQNRSAC